MVHETTYFQPVILYLVPLCYYVVFSALESMEDEVNEPNPQEVTGDTIQATQMSVVKEVEGGNQDLASVVTEDQGGNQEPEDEGGRGRWDMRALMIHALSAVLRRRNEMRA